MSREMEKIKKILESYPENCPYCFKKLKTKLLKATSSVELYCSHCDNYIDEEWDYLHAIAKIVKKYSIIEDGTDIIDMRKKTKQ